MGAGRPCSVCSHAERADIERRLLAGEALRKVSARTGTTIQSLTRHRDNHMSRSVAAAADRERQEVAETHDASLLDQVRDLHKKALALMAQSYRAGDLRTALSGVSAATKLLELQGKFLGQIAPTTINVLISQEFKTIQVALLSALDDFPAAKQSVLRALERIQ
jgi:hypothetical protein